MSEVKIGCHMPLTAWTQQAVSYLRWSDQLSQLFQKMKTMTKLDRYLVVLVQHEGDQLAAALY